VECLLGLAARPLHYLLKLRVEIRVVDRDPHGCAYFGKLDSVCIRMKSWLRIRIEVLNSGAVEAQNEAMGGPKARSTEAWRLKMEMEMELWGSVDQ
jgi:hypothetical protein